MHVGWIRREHLDDRRLPNGVSERLADHLFTPSAYDHTASAYDHTAGSLDLCDFCHASEFLQGSLREGLIFCCLWQVDYKSGD
jgi:hypothetical protein